MRIKAYYIPLFLYDNSLMLLINDVSFKVITVDNSSLQGCLIARIHCSRKRGMATITRAYNDLSQRLCHSLPA